MQCLIPQSRLMTVKQKHYFFFFFNSHSLTLSQGHTPSSCSEDCNVKLWCKVPLEPVLIFSHREKQHQHLKSMEVPFRKHSLFGQLGEKPSMENGGDLKRWYFTCIMIIRNKGRQCQHSHLDLVLLDVTFETYERFSFVFVNICV